MSPDFPQEIREEARNEAVKLAEERGRREQMVDSRLGDHDRQFLALNGSIDRLARGQEQTTKEIGRTNEKLGSVVTEIKNAKIAQEAVAKAIDKKRRNTQWWLRVVGGVTASLIVLLAALIGSHVI